MFFSSSSSYCKFFNYYLLFENGFEFLLLNVTTGDGHEVEEIEETDVVVTNPSKTVVEEIQDVSLDAVFSDNDETEVLGGDDSDSDGFLEEVWIFFYFVGLNVFLVQ